MAFLNIEQSIDETIRRAKSNNEFFDKVEKKKTLLATKNKDHMSLDKIDNWLDAIIYEDGRRLSPSSHRKIELIRQAADPSKSRKRENIAAAKEFLEDILKIKKVLSKWNASGHELLEENEKQIESIEVVLKMINENT
jgi:phosphoenolpyruvate carboxylase